MKRLTAIAAALLAGALLTGCGSASDSAGYDNDAASAPAEAELAEPERDDSGDAETGVAADSGEEDADGDAAGPISAAGAIDPAPRDIIYTIDLAVETDDVVRSAARASALAEAAGGFVANETTHGADHATLTLRVPSDRHAGLVAELEGFGEVVERSRSAEDVTADLVDLEARVASQRRSIDRIRELLDDATDLGDVVRIESELARREADLDSLLRRREQLSGLAALATVTVTFYADDAESDDESDEPVLGFVPGLSTGWDALVATARVAGTVVGAVLPFAALTTVLAVPAWIAWRRVRTTRAPVADTGHARIDG